MKRVHYRRFRNVAQRKINHWPMVRLENLTELEMADYAPASHQTEAWLPTASPHIGTIATRGNVLLVGMSGSYGHVGWRSSSTSSPRSARLT